jgi:hypothetical protein
VAVGDVNNDGKPDVLVAMYGGVRLFLNLGGMKFKDVSAEAEVSSRGWATSSSFLDYDRDGRLDIFAGNYIDFDPAATPLPDVFGIDRLTAPRLAAWVVRPADLDVTVRTARERGYDPGDVAPLSRRTPDGHLLEWRLTPNRGDRFDGLAPALIDWQNARHPTAGGLPQLRLVALTGRHPDPAAVRRALAALDVTLDVTAGPAALEAVLDTPHGPITIS